VIDEGDPTADAVNGAIQTLDPKLLTIYSARVNIRAQLWPVPSQR